MSPSSIQTEGENWVSVGLEKGSSSGVVVKEDTGSSLSDTC